MRQYRKYVLVSTLTGALALGGIGLGSAGASVAGEYPAAACDALARGITDSSALRAMAQDIGASEELLAAGTQTKLLQAADDADAQVKQDKKYKKDKKKYKKSKKSKKKSKKFQKRYKKARNASKNLARSRDAAIKDALDWCIGIGGATTTTTRATSGGSGGGTATTRPHTTTTRPHTTTTRPHTTTTTDPFCFESPPGSGNIVCA